ncbi:MAG: response regulator transcription factor [Desulfovibrionales bacterium]|nr:response regulator transcription factor [Desulfovibrionales bacterium]
MEELYRVVLAEDHTLLREGLKSLMQSFERFEVVGEASDGYQAVGLCETLRVDLVLMDLSMPKLDGLKATKIIKRNVPSIKVLVITQYDANDYVHSALSAGADGYILKDATSEEFLLAVTSLLNGKTYISPSVANGIIQGYLSGGTLDQSESLLSDLTPREEEIFQLVAEGYKSREIAEMLVVSIKTVEKHRSNLMQKLKVHSAAELKEFAAQQGVIFKKPTLSA